MSDHLLHEEDSIDCPCRRKSGRFWIAIGLVIAALLTFAMVTPPGLLRKADMVGYAVCHQIPSHSFLLGGSRLPLCARCTGTFLGALVGLVGQVALLRRRRASRFPPPAVLIVLIGFSFVWAVDGLNSYVFLVGGPHLYEPSNHLRLLTGASNGLTMSALVYPVFNLSLWRRVDDAANLRHMGDLARLVALEAVMVALILSRWDILLYPLTLLSAAAVLFLLSSVNTVFVVVLLGRENEASNCQQALPSLLLGLVLTFVQLGVINLIRYQLTGTLEGLPLP